MNAWIVRARRSYGLDWILVFAFTACLIWPLFRVKYLDLWASIESTFIADARFLKDHWPHPNWQPNWYCGTRTDYVYPPALRYGTAALAKYVPNMLPVRAYHLYTAFFYCFGIAGVYLLTRWASRSRLSGLVAAAATALISPTFLFARSIRNDTPLWMPQRLHVLVHYGEGPHMTALAWIPLALLFTFRAFTQGRPASVAGAAFCCAMIVSNNFYGATALAMFYPVLLWSVFITHLDRSVWIRAAVIPALTYGLTAFWLVPSYLRITLDNMRFVASAGNRWSAWLALVVIAGFALLSWRLARGKRDQAWFTFLCGSLALFSLNVLGNYFFNFRILGEPGRLFPELDMIMILFAVEVLRRFVSAEWRWPRLRRALATAVVIGALASSWQYVSQPRAVFVRDPKPEERVEFQLQDWMARNKPTARAVTSGSVRFWYNAWHDLPQLGGGSEQGLLNWHIVPAQWEIFLGPEPTLSVLWMQVLGVDAVIVNGRASRERYHDHVYPDKFRGVLPVLHDNGAGDTIYGVSRRYPSLARVVDRAHFEALPEIPGNGDLASLTAWHTVVEEGPDAPTETRWEGTDILHVRAGVAPGQSVWVQESFDQNWRAYSGTQRLPVRGDKLGFMLIDAPPGQHEIRLEFPTPLSNVVGRALTSLSVLALAGLLLLDRRNP